MKLRLTFACLFALTLAATSQKREALYDYNKKTATSNPARFYSVVEFKDSLWMREDYYLQERGLQMKGSYKDSLCKIAQGTYVSYHPNGLLQTTGQYINNKKQGTWVSYHDNGMMSDSAFYEDGKVLGLQYRYHANGYLADSIVRNKDGSGVSVSWFDNGTLAAIGRYQKGKMQGKWEFFHASGKVSGYEVYEEGKLLSQEYFDEEAMPITDTSLITRAAAFPGGIQGWRQYLQRNLNANAPVQHRAPVGSYTVVVQYIINTDGSVSDIKPVTAYGYGMEEEAVRVIKKGPKWEAAIQHGRLIKAYRRQPITFVVSQ